MEKIIECIPNFSEGRNRKKIAAIVRAITDISGVILLDQGSDATHNRSVISFAGEPEAVLEAAFAATKKAAELIDLDKHRGAHPRMGATDVLPLVPIRGVSEKECVAYAEKLGRRIGNELKIPVYLYEKAAKTAERKNLAAVRNGEYETIKKEIEKMAARKPDFGPHKLGKAGATAVGVRAPLIAYNVNLKSKNLGLAKTIAKKIRFKDGGFKCVKALGFALKNRGLVQVSMNLTDYQETAMHTVFEEIKREAKKHGVQISESEIIGLIPQKALIETAKYYLKIPALSNRQILETVLQNDAKSGESLAEFLDQVASKKPVPGGGSVSALAGALAAALVSMVANLTLTNKKYKKVHKETEKNLNLTERLRHQLHQLIETDSEAYQKVVEAYKSGKKKLIQQALKTAAKTPLEIAQTAAQLLKPIHFLKIKGNQNAASDCEVARYMTEACIKGAIANVEINLKKISDKKFVQTKQKQGQTIMKMLLHNQGK